MKNSFRVWVVCLLFNLAAQAQSKEEQQVAAAVETLKKAMLDANKSQLEAITAKELSYGHSSGKLEDKAAFVEALVSGQSDFVSMDLAEQSIRLSGNTAIVRHRLTGEIVDNGQAANVKLGVMLVWQKQKGQWKLLGRQAYKL
jgi:ABC-type transporter MlaC component